MGKDRRRVKPRNIAAKSLPTHKHKVYRDRTKYNRKRKIKDHRDADT